MNEEMKEGIYTCMRVACNQKPPQTSLSSAWPQVMALKRGTLPPGRRQALTGTGVGGKHLPLAGAQKNLREPRCPKERPSWAHWVPAQTRTFPALSLTLVFTSSGGTARVDVGHQLWADPLEAARKGSLPAV